METLLNPSELPLDAQVEKMEHLLKTLRDRGFDVDHAVLDPARGTAGVIILTLASPTIEVADVGPESDERTRSLGKWRESLNGELEATAARLGLTLPDDYGQVMGASIGELMPRVVGWLSSLSLRDLLAWQAPSASEFEGRLDKADPPSPEARWIFDRFVTTYLDEWATTSLDLEWAYIHGNLVAPCARDAMRTRIVQESELAVVLAHRKHEKNGASDEHMVSVTALVASAVEHLRAGRRTVAAAIFDSCRRAKPHNGVAHNNYGFCILPDDPSGALEALNVAAKLGMESEPVNVANRMLAMWRLGRVTSALELGQKFMEASPKDDSGYLWQVDPEGNPELVHARSVIGYVTSLGLVIAESASDQTMAKVWHSHRIAFESGREA
jgi:hypothetical protein